MRLVVVTMLAGLVIASPGGARVSGASEPVPTAMGKAHAAGSPMMPSAQQHGEGMDHVDVNVTLGEGASAHHAWYTQPIWIAMFVLGGLVLLVLLVMALRGSGTGAATVVKG